jgi:beta-phosphoglucomutase-like phosphatase (HAD superfamily)
MNDTAQEVWPRTSEVAEPRPSEIVPAAAHGLGVRRKRIVIVGDGFAGIAAARALKTMRR